MRKRDIFICILGTNFILVSVVVVALGCICVDPNYETWRPYICADSGELGVAMIIIGIVGVVVISFVLFFVTNCIEVLTAPFI